MEGSPSSGGRPAPGSQGEAHQELPVAIRYPRGGSPERDCPAAAGAATATGGGAAAAACAVTGSGIAATAAAEAGWGTPTAGVRGVPLHPRHRHPPAWPNLPRVGVQVLLPGREGKA